ncbi:MAG TPA: hypothetical protein VMS64_02080 [Candidatus Methylomirabilis sp.]|nr:hypothetical protein [Candidatus Methylomirabilis sp.]
MAGALDQPSGGGFDLGDVLYLVVPLTWLHALDPFLATAGIGAPRALRLDDPASAAVMPVAPTCFVVP